MRARLAGAGFGDSTVRRTLGRLRRLRYVDDSRLALAAAERSARRGQGSERVRADLERRGLDAATVEEAVAAVFVDEAALAREAVERRFRQLPGDATEKGRVARFLLGRGFPESVVLAIVGEGC